MPIADGRALHIRAPAARAAGTHGSWAWLPAAAAGLLGLALYTRTLAPGLTWAHDGADGGDLLAAALTGGVPHPPGYPTYQLVLRLVIAVLPSSPARAGNWVSAICAALAAAFLADLARRMLRQSRRGGCCAAIAALAWAVSPAVWSQAVITEVYTLNALFVALLLWILWRWREALLSGRSGRRWLALTALTFGLGLGNHPSLGLMLPGAATWYWSNRRAAGAASNWGWPVALACLVLGLCVYAYVPLAASGNPPVNWGDARTPAGFWWLVSGQAYRSLVFGIETRYLPARAFGWASEVLRQFGWALGALGALAGLWRLDRQDHAWWQTTGLTALVCTVFAIGYDTTDSYVYLIPAWSMAALWLAVGLDWGVRLVDQALVRRRHTFAAAEGVGHPALRGGALISTAVMAVLFAAIPGVSVARYWHQMDLSGDRTAEKYVSDALADAAPSGVILTGSDARTLALWYALYGLGWRRDLTSVNVHLYGFSWYRQMLAEHHPGLAGAISIAEPESIDRFAERAAQIAPVYRGDALDMMLPGFVERPAGSLVQLLPP